MFLSHLPACTHLPAHLLSVCPLFLSVCRLLRLATDTHRISDVELYVQEYSGFTGLFRVPGKCSLREATNLITPPSIPFSRYLPPSICTPVCVSASRHACIPQTQKTVLISCNYLQHLSTCLSVDMSVCLLTCLHANPKSCLSLSVAGNKC